MRRSRMNTYYLHVYLMKTLIMNCWILCFVTTGNWKSHAFISCSLFMLFKSVKWPCDGFLVMSTKLVSPTTGYIVCTRAFPAKFMWQVYIESSLWCSAVYSFVWTMQEGEFASLSVRRLRKRQMRNFFVCLMVSQVRISVWSFKFFMGCAFRSLFVQGRTQGCICSQWYAGIVEYVSLVQSLSLVTWWGLLLTRLWLACCGTNVPLLKYK